MTIPKISQIQQRYKDDGLVIIGEHSGLTAVAGNLAEAGRTPSRTIFFLLTQV